MYTFNINEIVEAVKFSGLVVFNKGDEKDIYDKFYNDKNSCLEYQYKHGYYEKYGYSY